MALTGEQQAAIEAQGPVGLVAGAGSGKTSVLAGRYIRLVKAGISPHAILTVTFTTDAAEELRSRIIAQLTHEGLEEMVLTAQATSSIGTIHSFCYRVLDAHGSTVGVPSIEAILDVAQWHAVLGEEYRRWLRETSPEVLERLDDRFGLEIVKEIAAKFYREHGVTAAPSSFEGELWNDLTAAINPLIDRLETRLRRSGLYSFDDLEFYCEQVLGTSPSVREHLRRQYAAVLVDEFQDTSRRQLRILENLVGDAPHKFFFVGDPKQSIYRFRQAEAALFSEQMARLPQSSGIALALTYNFRSRAELLVPLNTYSAAHFPNSSMLPGREASAELHLHEPLAVRRYSAGQNRAEIATSENKAIVQEILRLVDRGVEPKDIAILCRTNSPIGEVKAQIERAGISVSCERTARLDESYICLDVFAFLNALLNPLDDLAFAAVLRGPLVGYKLEELWRLSSQVGDSLFEKSLKGQDDRVTWFHSLVESDEWDLRVALSLAFGRLGSVPNATAALSLLNTLFAHCGDVPSAVFLLGESLEEGLLYSCDDRHPNGVILSTVHAAKGLEFPHVFIIDCLRQPPTRRPVYALDRDGFPALRWREKGEWIESERYQLLMNEDRTLEDGESLRILYVALTRARESLTIFLPEERNKLPKRSWAATLNPLLDSLPTLQPK
ncbi:MAG: UvrD-helicase domain-containing protein [Deltaproteobacteria bacterium]|nr:UvrD-helicase domain-containing protein [Deltaproteobacteria bacterium]MBI3294398.1 UvrD-helicase domain-containing protein [Deltaproteobacteria bacterium]